MLKESVALQFDGWFDNSVKFQPVKIQRDGTIPVLKESGQFAMPETCKIRLDVVNSCINYAHQTREIYQVQPYSVDFKTPREFWNPLSQTVLSKCSFIWNKGP